MHVLELVHLLCVCVSFTAEILCTNSVGLDAVPVSNGNIRTLLSVGLRRTALFKVFNLKDDFNLLYTQYCFGIAY